MGHLPLTDEQSARGSLIARSAHSLRGAVTALGGAAFVSTLAFAETAAKELSRAERRRRRRERERERDEDREERLKRDRDEDDDDDVDRIAVLKAKHAALMDRASGSPRRRTAQQTADEKAADDSTPAGRSRTQRQEATQSDETTTEEPVVREAAQVTEETDSGTTVLRVGSGDTFASIDRATGTATAESNGVKAIAGPDGAFIEGTPGGTSTTPEDPAAPADGNDDGTVDGGNNVDPGLLS